MTLRLFHHYTPKGRIVAMAAGAMTVWITTKSELSLDDIRPRLSLCRASLIHGLPTIRLCNGALTIVLGGDLHSKEANSPSHDMKTLGNKPGSSLSSHIPYALPPCAMRMPRHDVIRKKEAQMRVYLNLVGLILQSSKELNRCQTQLIIAAPA
jgi:hypothetical protein